MQKRKKSDAFEFFLKRKKKVTGLGCYRKKGSLNEFSTKKFTQKHAHTQRERERVVVVIVSAFCFRAQREELSVGVLNMGRPRKDAPPVSSKNKTTRGMMSGKKIDRRKKEFRNLPKSKTKKQKRYGPPSHILKATIAPKFKEMREQHQSYNNTTTNNSSRGVMFNNGGGGGGKEEEEFNNNNAKKFNEEENEDGKKRRGENATWWERKRTLQTRERERERQRRRLLLPRIIRTRQEEEEERQQQQRRRRARTRTKKTR